MKSRRLIFFCIALGALSSCASRTRKVCPNLELVDQKLSFSDSEKKLLCGDKKNPDWNEIPRNQVIYHLRTFLLERGYFDPQFEEEPDRVKVRVGPKTTLKKIEFSGWAKEVPEFSMQRYLNLPLTPKTLTEVETAVQKAHKAEGYACVKTDVKALAEEGRVLIEILPGKKLNFGEISRSQSEGLDTLVLSRFEPFQAEDSYDYKLLELSERRIRSSGLVQDVAYLPKCEDDSFEITQRSFSGKSRFLSLGAGFDTEQWIIAKARLSLSRLTTKGSNFETLLFASAKVQSLSTLSRFHLWPPTSRNFIYAGAEGERREEKHFETIEGIVRTGFGRTGDLKDWGWEMRLGPRLERLWLFRGTGLKNSKALGLEGSFSWMSHVFEYQQGEPQSGTLATLDFKSSHEEVGATFSALRMKLFSEKMFQLWEDYKRDFILGFRSFVATTVQPEGRERSQRIPPSYRHFLGGASDLRGFSRLELPKSGQGAFSSAYFGTEFRWARQFKLEPLVFFDVGALGTNSFDIKAPTYLSPGIGTRYKSPFGTLRGSLARGYTVGGGPESERSEHYQFFISFGQEF